MFYSIATVIDDFIDRIMVDPRLNANQLVEEAHHRVPPAGFKYLVTEMVCWATGSPKVHGPLYEGATSFPESLRAFGIDVPAQLLARAIEVIGLEPMSAFGGKADMAGSGVTA